MTTTAFIVVFRPHQRPAWAETYDSEADFVRAWQNGCFARSCFAEPGSEPGSYDNFDEAWQDVGHDLNSLTRLDSAEEVARYLNERDYAGHHNKGLTSVRRAAEELGWLGSEEEEDDA